MTKTYEMLWDCNYCDTKKLLGISHKYCPNCGTAQDPTKRYFPEENDKVAVEDHQFVGVDKVCPYCDAPNSATSTFCTECAAPLDGSKEVNLVKDAQDLETPKSPEPSKPTKSKKKWIFGGIFLFILLVVGLFQITEERSVTVESHSWSRTIDIEKYKTVSESDWKDRVPIDGKIKTCRSKERNTKQVPDGEECSTVRTDNGDGTYNESQKCQTKYKSIPIYDDWCKYDINKWVVVNTKEEKGITLEPIWPELKIQSCSIKALNCEREGSRVEVYKIHLTDDTNEQHFCKFAQAKWESIQINTEKIMKFGQITGNIDCGSWDE